MDIQVTLHQSRESSQAKGVRTLAVVGGFDVGVNQSWVEKDYSIGTEPAYHGFEWEETVLLHIQKYSRMIACTDMATEVHSRPMPTRDHPALKCP